MATIKGITASLFDTRRIDDYDSERAEMAYISALFAEVPSVELLELIYADERAGVEAGLAHFEKTNGAWGRLDRIGMRAAEKSLGYWPAEGAHFEVQFSAPEYSSALVDTEKSGTGGIAVSINVEKLRVDADIKAAQYRRRSIMISGVSDAIN